MVVKGSNIRGKKEILEELNRPPDPQQVKFQQMQMELQIAEMQAKIAEMQAKANKANTDAETKAAITPADIQLKQAQAMKAAADAGKSSAGG